jgi:hypothetical protein
VGAFTPAWHLSGSFTSGLSPSIAYPGLSKIHQPHCCQRSPAVIYVVLEDTNQSQETHRDASAYCTCGTGECGRCAKDTEACSSVFWLWRRGIWQVYGCVLSVGVFQWDTSVAARPAGLMHRVTSTGCSPRGFGLSGVEGFWAVRYRGVLGGQVLRSQKNCGTCRYMQPYIRAGAHRFLPRPVFLCVYPTGVVCSVHRCTRDSNML